MPLLNSAPSKALNFSGLTEDLRPNDIHPYDFSCFRQEFRPNGRILRLGFMLPEVDGLYLPHENYTKYKSEGRLPDRFQFVQHSALSVGREDSRHEVVFGDVYTKRFTNEEDKVLRVAVKPFRGRERVDLLAQELAMFQELGAVGLEHPVELGLLKDKSDRYLITEFKPEMISLDSIDWKNIDKDTEEHTINRALSSLANLHSYGLAHGDASPRNISIQPNMNEDWFVDLEYGVGVENTANILSSIKNDLRDFYYGLNKLKNEPTTYPDMVDTILVPYGRIVAGKNKGDGRVSQIYELLNYICYDFMQEFIDEPV